MQKFKITKAPETKEWGLDLEAQPLNFKETRGYAQEEAFFNSAVEWLDT